MDSDFRDGAATLNLHSWSFRAEPRSGEGEESPGLVIPSGAPKVRRRGIAVLPVEGQAPRSGGVRFLASALRAPLGMTRRRLAATLGMTGVT